MSAAVPEIHLATIAHYRGALKEIAALAMRCDEGDCADNYEDGEGKHRVATHVTSMWGAPVYLCAEHAPARAENHRDAESKGSGKA